MSAKLELYKYTGKDGDFGTHVESLGIKRIDTCVYILRKLLTGIQSHLMMQVIVPPIVYTVPILQNVKPIHSNVFLNWF